MKIAIRKEQNGSIYIDKTALQRFDEEVLKQPPYNYSFVEVEKEDFEPYDFNDDLTFSIEKYNERKQNALNLVRIGQIQTRLNELSQDFIQINLGAVFDDLEQRKQEFKFLHNELRSLLGKEPREYKEI